MKADVLQVFISISAVFGIGILWINFNEKVFRTVRDLVKAPFTDNDSCDAENESDINCLELCPFAYTAEHAMFDNKLVKTIASVATLTGLAAGIGWVAKKKR